MDSSAVLDTVLGLVAVFYALALLCSGLVEMIANLVKKRAKYLLRGLRDLLEDPPVVDWSGSALHPVANASAELSRYSGALLAPLSSTPGQTPRAAVGVEDVMGHALVQPFRHTTSLGRPTRNPAYLPAPVFSGVLVDLLTPRATVGALSAEQVQTGIDALTASPKLQQALSGLMKVGRGDLEVFRGSVERWFDAQMERVAGSYKRWAKRWVLVLAVVVVGVGGVDAVAIARTLYADEAARASVVAQVGDAKFCPPETDPSTCAREARRVLQTSGLPIGWSAPDRADGVWGWPLKLLGLMISVGATVLGAPFWYRLLDRIGSLRNTGRRPSSS